MVYTQSLDQDQKIELFELSEWDLVSPANALRFCAHQGVVFYGAAYEAISIVGTGFDLIGHGTPPEPKIVISNLGRVVGDWIFHCRANPTKLRLEGCKVRRRLTQRKFLDGGPMAGAAIREEPTHVFYLEQIEAEDRHTVTMSLSDPFNQRGETLPSSAAIALRTCRFAYRDPDTCGYAGTAYFTRTGQPTVNPALDDCGHRVSDCELRHGLADLPFGGYPGLGV